MKLSNYMKKYQLTTTGFKKARVLKITQVSKPISISDCTLYAAIQGKIFSDKTLLVLLTNMPNLKLGIDYIEIEQAPKPEKVVKSAKQGKQPKYIILPQGVIFIGELGRPVDFIAKNCGFNTFILTNFLKSGQYQHYSITKKMLELFKKRYRGFEEGIHYAEVSKENNL